ncbi:hypothetical protein [Stygiolobus caldivivus]|uniref:Uncharacterized protein n=1 Tax=Stygiolobus caldivivus TaxID=2824673 RepID=A0A8D5ZI35_9CREN|nr:hypothetical protein [Stygiolobus caldivivus]BCU68942.1 hypothetical protein KN1_02390 [Stygiolobus caldivivus]
MMAMLFPFAVATYAPPSSIGFEDVFGFGLAALAFAFGVIFLLLVKKKIVNIF